MVSEETNEIAITLRTIQQDFNAWMMWIRICDALQNRLMARRYAIKRKRFLSYCAAIQQHTAINHDDGVLQTEDRKIAWARKRTPHDRRKTFAEQVEATGMPLVVLSDLAGVRYLWIKWMTQCRFVPNTIQQERLALVMHVPPTQIRWPMWEDGVVVDDPGGDHETDHSTIR